MTKCHVEPIQKNHILILVLLLNVIGSTTNSLAEQTNLSPDFVSKYSHGLNVSMSEVIQDLINVSVRINFEECPIKNADAMTIQTVLERYGEIEKDKLTSHEARLLNKGSELKKGGVAPNTIIDYNVKRFELKLPPNVKDVQSLLDVLTTLDNRYRFQCSNNSVILTPKQNSYATRITFKVAQVSVSNAYQELIKKVLQPNDLHLIALQPLPYVNDTSSKVTLALEDVDIYTCLTRFVESLGPDAIWSISGIEGKRLISFSSPPK